MEIILALVAVILLIVWMELYRARARRRRWEAQIQEAARTQVKERHIETLHALRRTYERPFVSPPPSRHGPRKFGSTPTIPSNRSYNPAPAKMSSDAESSFLPAAIATAMFYSGSDNSPSNSPQVPQSPTFTGEGGAFGGAGAEASFEGPGSEAVASQVSIPDPIPDPIPDLIPDPPQVSIPDSPDSWSS